MKQIVIVYLLCASFLVGMEKEEENKPIPPLPPTPIQKLMMCQKASAAQNAIVNSKTLFTENYVDFDKIYNYPMGRVLRKYMFDYNVPLQQAELTEFEFKSFITNASQVSYPSRIKSKPVSDLWHTFLLFSRDYYMFCFQCFGKMVHHDPSVCDALSSSIVSSINPCNSGF